MFYAKSKYILTYFLLRDHPHTTSDDFSPFLTPFVGYFYKYQHIENQIWLDPLSPYKIRRSMWMLPNHRPLFCISFWLNSQGICQNMHIIFLLYWKQSLELSAFKERVKPSFTVKSTYVQIKSEIHDPLFFHLPVNHSVDNIH